MSQLSVLFQQLKERKKWLFYLLMLSLLNSIVFVFITYRIQNKQQQLGVQEIKLEREFAQKQLDYQSLSKTGARASKNAQAVSQFWTEIVKMRVPGLTDAWAEIDKIAREVNVVKTRTGYSRNVLDIGLEEIKATMPLEGSYFNLVRFINRLERSKRFFLLEGVRLSQSESKDGTIRLDCSILFYLKSEATNEVKS